MKSSSNSFSPYFLLLVFLLLFLPVPPLLLLLLLLLPVGGNHFAFANKSTWLGNDAASTANCERRRLAGEAFDPEPRRPLERCAAREDNVRVSLKSVLLIKTC